MENQEFNLNTDELYTGSIEWNAQRDESPCGGCELDINGQRIPLEDLGKYLTRFEGWKIDLKIYDK